MKWFAVIAAGLAGTASVAAARAPARVDATLAYVISGGWWERGDAHGRYRVLVYSPGFEHVISQVFVEWVQEPSESDQLPQVISTLPIDAVNAQPTWTVGLPKLR